MSNERLATLAARASAALTGLGLPSVTLDGLRPSRILDLIGALGAPPCRGGGTLEERMVLRDQAAKALCALYLALREKPAGGRTGVRTATVAVLDAELVRAREKFPGNRFLLAALAEEVGELAEAHEAHGANAESTRKEALQVMCVAARIYEEGDATTYNHDGILALVAAFGRIARRHLQRGDVPAAVADLWEALDLFAANDGDSTFNSITDEEAKL